MRQVNNLKHMTHGQETKKNSNAPRLRSFCLSDVSFSLYAHEEDNIENA